MLGFNLQDFYIKMKAATFTGSGFLIVSFKISKFVQNSYNLIKTYYDSKENNLRSKPLVLTDWRLKFYKKSFNCNMINYK